MDDLCALVIATRLKIHNSDAGTMHGMWDLLFDLKCYIDGRPTFLSREEIHSYVIPKLREFVGQGKDKSS